MGMYFARGRTGRTARSPQRPYHSGRSVRLLLTLVVVAVLSACTSAPQPIEPDTSASPSSSPVPGSSPETWPMPNGDESSTRQAAGDALTTETIAGLEAVWTAAVDGSGRFAAGAVVDDGRVFVQDLASNVTALDLDTGRQLWSYPVGDSTLGPNGLAVSDGVVFGMTSSEAFALDAATGDVRWRNDELSTSETGPFDTQPLVSDGRVYVCTAGAGASTGGVAYGLDETTGQTLWSFATMTDISDGVRDGGMGAGGCWAAATAGPDGSVLFGVGNPYQSPRSAIESSDPQLYSNSVVTLDGATGRLRWYFQAAPNDFYDFDLHLSPISTRIDGRDVVIASGKLGIVYALDGRTGDVIWELPVGIHNGHDDDGRRALEGTLELSGTPYTVYPGSLGGVTTAMALTDDTVYVPVLNLPSTVNSPDQVRGSNNASQGTGEMVAINVTTGEQIWSAELPAIPLGAATVTGDLVLTGLYDGTLIAIDRATGDIVFDTQAPGTSISPLTVVGGTVLVVTDRVTAYRLA